MLEGRQESRGAQIELLSRAYLARTVHGSRSLLAQADLRVHKSGSRLDESLDGLRRYGCRCLDVSLMSRFAVRLSKSPSAQGQRLRVLLVVMYHVRAGGGVGAWTGVGLDQWYGQ